MKLGVYLDLRNPGARVPWPLLYKQALELCEQIEEWGAASVWLSEHHAFDDGYLPQPLTFAAAVAARTSRIRIGTAVFLAALRSPAQLLEEATVVDLLSDGRLDLGLGAGYRQAEFHLYGLTPPAKPLERLFEIHAEIERLRAEGLVTPLPVQQPLPVWLGCNGPRGANRVGQVGAPLLSVRRSIFDAYREGLIAGGHDPARAKVSGPVNVFLADDPERVREQVARAYDYIWNSYAAHADGAGEVSAGTHSERAIELGLEGGLRGLLIATPERAAQELMRYFDGVPVDTVFAWGRLPGVDDVAMHRHLELWCRELPGLMSPRASTTVVEPEQAGRQ